MGVRTASARAAWVVGAAVLAASAAVAVPQAALAETCSGDVTWTGGAANGSWSDTGNWSGNQVPGATERAVVDTAAGVITGLSGSVCGLKVTGGTADSPVTLAGDLQVSGALELAGSVRYDGDEAGIVAGSLTTAPATDLTFLDGTADLQVTGGGVLGGTTTLHRAADPVGSAAALVVGGTLELDGDGVALQDVGLSLSGVLDLKSRLLTVAGAATSHLASGAVVKDTVGAPTAALDLATPLTTDGTVTVTSPARLRLSTGAALTTEAPTTLSGTGTFLWRGGTLTGDLTLALPSATETDAAKALTGTTSKLTVVTGQTLAVGASGVVSVAGVVDNRGILALGSGTKLVGTAAEAQLLNPGSGKITVVTGIGTLDAVPVIGTGTLATGTGTGSSTARLLLTRSAWAADSTALTTSQLQPGTTVRGGGFVQVGKGAAVALSGTVNLTEGSVLELDDDSDGTAAHLDATSATLLGTGSGATNGTFHWRSGQVRGQLTLDKLVTEAGNSGSDNGTPTGRQLHPLDATTRGKLTVLGPLVMQSARVVVQPRTDVVLSGASTFKLVGGFTAGNAATPDATATMTPTSSLAVAPSTVELFGTLPSAGVFDLPLTNQGDVTVSGGSSLAGSRIVNQGTVLLSNATMTSPKGYVQQKRTGSTEDPVTAILTSLPTTENPNPPPSTLSAVVGDKRDSVLISAGGLYGNGTVKALTTTVASGWVRPFVSETAPGKLRVEGELVLGAGSDLQLLVGPVDTASTANPKPVLRDRVEVVAIPGATGQPDVAPGKATLGGRITGLTRQGYSPAYLANAGSVLTAATRVGTFASAAWSPSSSGLGWKPVYNGNAVELQFVDVSPPALGLAGIPAFTPLSSQRVTYAAVDNKSGVKSFDVRYRPSTPSMVGSWFYPASWQNRTSTVVDQTGLAAGWTYCYSVRARDKAGNTTNWSQPLCTTRMADDRSWSAHGSWTRPSGVSGFYGSTFSRSTAAGAYLKATGTHNRVAVTALRCPTCGVIDVYSGSTKLARVDLRSSSNVMRTWTSAQLTNRTAPVLVRVVTSGRPVVIDAVALRRT